MDGIGGCVATGSAWAALSRGAASGAGGDARPAGGGAGAPVAGSAAAAAILLVPLPDRELCEPCGAAPMSAGPQLCSKPTGGTTRSQRALTEVASRWAPHPHPPTDHTKHFQCPHASRLGGTPYQCLQSAPRYCNPSGAAGCQGAHPGGAPLSGACTPGCPPRVCTPLYNKGLVCVCACVCGGGGGV